MAEEHAADGRRQPDAAKRRKPTKRVGQAGGQHASAKAPASGPARNQAGAAPASQRPASGGQARTRGDAGRASATRPQRAPRSKTGQTGRAAPHSPSPKGSPRKPHDGHERASAGVGRVAGAKGPAQTYNAPALWTKGPLPDDKGGNAAVRALRGAGRLLAGFVLLLGRGLGLLVRGLGTLLRTSRLAMVAFVLVAVLLAGGVADLAINGGKVYAGVRVGEVDLSGKTVDEARSLVEAHYAQRLAQGSVVIFANEESEARLASATQQAEDAALAEQVSVEEARANKQAWTADATSLSASLATEALVEEALAVGRENGGLLARASALFGGWLIAPRADYGTTELEALASDIDAAIGTVRVDFSMAIEGGTARVTEGHDGNMVDRSAFARELDGAFLSAAGGEGSFVATTAPAPLRVTREGAQATCDAVNASLAPGAVFSYGQSSWTASAADLGAWVTTSVEQAGDGYALVPRLDVAVAKPAVLAHVQKSEAHEALAVTFSVADGVATVHTNGTGEIPLVTETVSDLDERLFAAYRQGLGLGEEGAGAAPAAATASAAQPVAISVVTGTAPSSLSLGEAVDLGIVSGFASYTTEYTNTDSTQNRNHNIHLVADLLSNSVVPANGGRWSFNGTAGECNEEAGFLGAGAIVEGEYDDAVGGGICQVATTVFNAVYDSGFPVITRHNHTLYIGSYPEGRDAAVSWPDLDLVWENDSSSDVLVQCTYTDASITATLYGVNPGYQVSTSVGQWAKGEEHATKTVRDETLRTGESYVKTAGVDGKSISLVRIVKGADGVVLHEDRFSSTYDPVTEVVMAGPEEKDAKDGSSGTGT